MKPDDLKDEVLKEILAKHPAPEPNKFVKQEHITNALAAFEKKMQKTTFSTQGTAFADRLTGTINQTGRLFMTVISGKHRASMAFASIALAALGISTALHLSQSDLGTSFSDVSAELVENKKMTKIAGADFEATPPQVKPLPLRPAMKKDELDAVLSSRGQVEAEKQMSVADSYVPVAPTAPVTRAKPMMSREMGMANMQSAPAGAATGFVGGGINIHQDYHLQQAYHGNDRFEHAEENAVKSVAAEPVSTFSIDVDTASYSFVRRQISRGAMPQPDMVRIEEMINYFPYAYPLPESRKEPFAPSVAVYPTPWNEETKLLHIGIKGYDIERKEAPNSNLVFLIDTSGSMQGADRLPLLVNCLKMLLETLKEDDTVGIVTYAGYSGVALEPTKVKDKAKILDVLNRLGAGGSTAGAQGIETAYQLAGQHFDKDAVNRVVLATDGDFNVGVSDPEQLKRVIEQKRKSGIFLSVLGFGEGNYNDALMQKLAQNGNGTAAYIDTLNEGRKVLVEEATSALFPIAKDVKIQVEFNPAVVAEYRLIGYETRHLNREDFNNDKVDAGELGAGHTVTALYEITPAGSKARLMDDLRYGDKEEKAEKPATSSSDEIAFLKLRYKLPSEDKSHLMTRPITAKDEVSDIAKESDDVRFAAAVAAFGQKLKNSRYVEDYGYDRIIQLADAARGADTFGYRAEFVNLVRLAQSLGVVNTTTPNVVPPQPVQPVPAPGVLGAPGYQTR